MLRRHDGWDRSKWTHCLRCCCPSRGLHRSRRGWRTSSASQNSGARNRHRSSTSTIVAAHAPDTMSAVTTSIDSSTGGTPEHALGRCHGHSQWNDQSHKARIADPAMARTVSTQSVVSASAPSESTPQSEEIRVDSHKEPQYDYDGPIDGVNNLKEAQSLSTDSKGRKNSRDNGTDLLANVNLG